MHKKFKSEGNLEQEFPKNMAFIGQIEYFVPENDFTLWKERLNCLLSLNKIEKDEEKINFIISFGGPDLYKVLKGLTEPRKVTECTFKEIDDILSNYFKPKRNIIAERFKFYKRNQKPHESLSDFMVDLKVLAQSCDFKAFLDEALRDRFVSGENSK